MSMFSPARSSSKPSAQSKVICTGCSTTDIDCAEPFCSSNELTAQCTDQCVVIACSDPNHGESVCDGGLTHANCSLACDETTQCTDCYGFDAFLQCCDEYRSSYADSSRPVQPSNAQHNYVWDASFENLWCIRDQQLGEPNKVVPVEQPVGSHPYALPAKEISPAIINPHLGSTCDSFSSNSRIPSLSKESINCMWDSCQGSFESLSDLVGHVNTHLPTNNGGSAYHSMDQLFSQDAVACLWAECENLYKPSPTDFQLLANHIFHEHLGVTYPTGPIASSSSRFTVPSLNPSCPTNQPEPTVSGDDYQTESPPTPLLYPTQTQQHSCTDIHECRWKGCGQMFDSCDDLTAHITTIHIGSGKSHYECYWEQCPRNGSQGFQSKQKICRHVQSHTGHRPFQCAICHQNFSEAATLQQHIRRHTQEKPYVCDFPGCGKSFAITGALTIHKRTHNGDKPFRCSFCDRGFAESSNLSKHLRTHTGARPYSCTEPGCNKSFARPDQLNRHKGVHKKQIRGINQTALE